MRKCRDSCCLAALILLGMFTLSPTNVRAQGDRVALGAGPDMDPTASPTVVVVGQTGRTGEIEIENVGDITADVQSVNVGNGKKSIAARA